MQLIMISFGYDIIKLDEDSEFPGGHVLLPNRGYPHLVQGIPHTAQESQKAASPATTTATTNSLTTNIAKNKQPATTRQQKPNRNETSGDEKPSLRR